MNSSMYETEVSGSGEIKHFWYDQNRSLKTNIENGQILVEIVWTVTAMQRALRALDNHSDDEERQDHDVSLWWLYEPPHDPKEPPIHLYYNDFFSVTLPHEVGLTLKKIFQRRLAEVASMIN